MSFVTGSVKETLYASIAQGATLTSFTSEAQLNTTATMGVQAHLPPDFWLPNPTQLGRGIKIVARGILSSTSTPAYTFSIRLGAAGSTTAAVVLGSAALTTAASASNAFWELEGDVILTAIGAAGPNSTVRGTGKISSPGLTGTNSGINPVWGGAGSPGTVATVDTSITNYVNVNVTCSASSPSNSITLLQLIVYGLN